MSMEPKKHVLFVDDEQGVLDGLRRLLRSMRDEWELHFAPGVDEALRILEAEPIDTVVSDVNMPVRDGFDLLATIRANEAWTGLPVVILTGNGEANLKRRALNLGATDLLAKPVSREDLQARIKSVLRMKEYEDRIRRHNRELEQRVIERTAQLEMAHIELIWRLGKAGEFRDSDTGYHVVRVGFFARELALELGCDDEYARQVFLTAPLHDIGKIGIPDGILLKPGKLSSEEWITMREHTTIGAQILRGEAVAQDHVRQLALRTEGKGIEVPDNPLMEMAALVAANHHERWDGKGYPANLGGEHIPLAARLTSVADVYDALCSKRPYKEPFTEKQVLEIMQRGSGTQFEPAVFEAFTRRVERFREIRAEFDDDRMEDPQADTASVLRDLEAA